MNQKKIAPARRTLVQSGFTLIELLVVIVIIGILATISVAQFNKYQRSARNAKTLIIARQYLTILKTYQTLNDGLLPTPAAAGVCLGVSYPAAGLFSVDQCGTSNTTTFIDTNYQSLLAAESGIIATSNHRISLGSREARGMVIFRMNNQPLDGVTSDFYYMDYYLEGAAQDCRLRPLINTDTWPSQIRVTTPYSLDTSYDATYCRVLIDAGKDF